MKNKNMNSYITLYTCAVNGCEKDLMFLQKCKERSFYCYEHNKCVYCEQKSGWDLRLCMDCDENYPYEFETITTKQIKQFTGNDKHDLKL